MPAEHGGQIPVYRQIANELRHMINTGQLGPGDKLPSETDLMGLHSVARQTARNAVNLLRDEGLVTKVQGRGAWVKGAAA